MRITARAYDHEAKLLGWNKVGDFRKSSFSSNTVKQRIKNTCEHFFWTEPSKDKKICYIEVVIYNKHIHCKHYVCLVTRKKDNSYSYAFVEEKLDDFKGDF